MGDHDANLRVPTNSPHDHFATPFLDHRTRTIRSVDSFEAAKQEYAVSSGNAIADCPKVDRYGQQVCLVRVNGKDMGLSQLEAGINARI